MCKCSTERRSKKMRLSLSAGKQSLVPSSGSSSNPHSEKSSTTRFRTSNAILGECDSRKCSTDEIRWGVTVIFENRWNWQDGTHCLDVRQQAERVCLLL